MDENKKNRHTLRGIDVVSTLTEFAKCAFRSTPLSSPRCEPQLNYSEFESGYVCKSCYRDLVKVQTLKKQLRGLKFDCKQGVQNHPCKSNHHQFYY